MVSCDFPEEAIAPTPAAREPEVSSEEMEMYNNLDLQWIDPSHGPSADFDTDLTQGSGTGLYQANFDLGYG